MLISISWKLQCNEYSQRTNKVKYTPRERKDKELWAGFSQFFKNVVPFLIPTGVIYLSTTDNPIETSIEKVSNHPIIKSKTENEISRIFSYSTNKN